MENNHFLWALFQLGEITLGKQTNSFCNLLITGPPTCQSLELSGSMVEGGRLTFHAVYTGG
jgi:hypothetical protein